MVGGKPDKEHARGSNRRFHTKRYCVAGENNNAGVNVMCIKYSMQYAGLQFWNVYMRVVCCGAYSQHVGLHIRTFAYHIQPQIWKFL